MDLVIPENSWEQKTDDIKKFEVDVFAMGDDWEGKFDFLAPYCEVLYLPRTSDISSADIKKSLRRFSVARDDIMQAFNILEQLKQDFE